MITLHFFIQLHIATYVLLSEITLFVRVTSDGTDISTGLADHSLEIAGNQTASTWFSI
jgi:hypothetical protein